MPCSTVGRTKSRSVACRSAVSSAMYAAPDPIGCRRSWLASSPALLAAQFASGHVDQRPFISAPASCDPQPPLAEVRAAFSVVVARLASLVALASYCRRPMIPSLSPNGSIAWQFDFAPDCRPVFACRRS